MKHSKHYVINVNWDHLIGSILIIACFVTSVFMVIDIVKDYESHHNNSMYEYNSAYKVYDSWHGEEIALALKTIETERENRELLEECLKQMEDEETEGEGNEEPDSGSIPDVGEVATESVVFNVSSVSEQVKESAPKVEATGQVTQCDNRELLAKLLCREAGGEGWDCQVYTCSAILNYCDHNNVSLNSAAHNSNSFSSAPTVDSASPSQTTYDVVDHVLNGGRIGEICFFRTGHYHSFGTPVIQVGAHYFSKP